VTGETLQAFLADLTAAASGGSVDDLETEACFEFTLHGFTG